MSTEIPSIPALNIPSEYEAWRIKSLNLGISRKTLTDHLISLNTEIALLRASQIIGIDLENREIAFELAGKLMVSKNSIFKLFGKYQSAFIILQDGIYVGNQAPAVVQATLPALLELLDQLKSSEEKTLLDLELEMRIHLAVSQAYTALGNFEKALLYASQIVIISPIVGLKSYISSGQSLTGWCLLMMGKASEATQVYKNLYEDEKLIESPWDTFPEACLAATQRGLG